jgi:hypothetical protein
MAHVIVMLFYVHYYYFNYLIIILNFATLAKNIET